MMNKEKGKRKRNNNNNNKKPYYGFILELPEFKKAITKAGVTKVLDPRSIKGLQMLTRTNMFQKEWNNELKKHPFGNRWKTAQWKINTTRLLREYGKLQEKRKIIIYDKNSTQKDVNTITNQINITKDKLRHQIKAFGLENELAYPEIRVLHNSPFHHLGRMNRKRRIEFENKTIRQLFNIFKRHGQKLNQNAMWNIYQTLGKP